MDPLERALRTVLLRRRRAHQGAAWAGAALFAIPGFVLGGAMGQLLRGAVEPHVLAMMMVSGPFLGGAAGLALGQVLAVALVRRQWSSWCAAAAAHTGCSVEELRSTLRYVVQTGPGDGV